MREQRVRRLEIRADRLPRYGLLLAAILAELVVAPVMASTETGLTTARIATFLVLLAALNAAAGHWRGYVLFALAAVGQAAVVATESPSLHVAELGVRLVFVAYVTGALMWRMMQHESVTLDTIAGAACAYLLIGTAWSAAYLLLETVRPGSFDIPPAWRAAGTGDPGAGLAYFSFSTLTTVGYGDVRPTWPAAGGLAVAEAVVGQLYLAITVARLVGLHVARPR